MRTRRSSAQRVQQEIEAVGARSPGLAPSSTLPSSLLSLPNDLLFMIFRELFEVEHGSDTSSAPVAEILITRRIFHLVRPLWLSRLSIPKPQLDLRLAELLDSQVRIDSLRRLDLHLEDSHTHLIRILLSRLSLTHLSLTIPETHLPDLSKQQQLGEVMSNLPPLTLLQLRTDGLSSRDRNKLWKNCIKKMQRGILELYVDGRLLYERVDREGLISVRTSGDSEKITGLKKIESYEIFPLWKDGTCDIKGFVLGLEQALESNNANTSDQQKLPLRRISLPLHHDAEEYSYYRRFPTETNFRKFFQLLPQTQVETLEFTFTDCITELSTQQLKAHTIKVLRLSGSLSFKDENTFKSFSQVLETLPSLVRLDLVGTSIFGSSAHEISMLNNTQLCFGHPELRALLCFLRGTRVKIFTFRGGRAEEEGEGEDTAKFLIEKREMRWTRNSENEDFEQECWSL